MVIAEQELKALRHALVDRNRKRLVVAATGVLHVDQRIPERIGCVRTGFVKSYGIDRHLVGIRRHGQIRTVAAVVGNAHTGLEAEIALDGEVPLLDVGIFVVKGVGQVKVLGAGLGKICRERVGERVLCLVILDGW